MGKQRQTKAKTDRKLRAKRERQGRLTLKDVGRFHMSNGLKLSTKMNPEWKLTDNSVLHELCPQLTFMIQIKSNQVRFTLASDSVLGQPLSRSERDELRTH